MLAKKYKLPIQHFPRSGAKSSHSGLFLLKKIDSGLPLSRFGVIISKKVASRASARNSLRRAVFDWVLKYGLHLRPGTDFLLIALPPAGSASKKDLSVALSHLLL